MVDAVEGEDVGCSCGVVMEGSKTLFTTRNGFTVGTVATISIYFNFARCLLNVLGRHVIPNKNLSYSFFRI